MAYSKQTWDTTSYVNPTRMNHIEDGIYNSAFADEITNITITNDRGGAESNKATLHYTGNIGILTGMFVCQDASSEKVSFDLPSGWRIGYGGIVIRDTTDGALVSAWTNDNYILTYNHTGTMTVGHTNTFSIFAFKTT